MSDLIRGLGVIVDVSGAVVKIDAAVGGVLNGLGYSQLSSYDKGQSGKLSRLYEVVKHRCLFSSARA